MARRKKNRVLQRIEYTAYRLIAGAVRRASEETVARWGARLGALSRRVLRSRDRLAMRNLRDSFPSRSESELRETLDKSWRYFGCEMLAFVRAQGYSLEELADRCTFVNTEILENARARGKGTILISGHYGGWEIAGLALMARVNNVRTVARPLDNELLERELAASRAHTGAEVVDRRRAARALLRGLAENAVIVLLPDQAVQPREGVLVPFMGRKAWTTDAPAKLALRSGATIVFGFCIPDRTRHQLEFEGPIVVDELNEAERNPMALTERINDVISRRIAARPELWFWMHDRWKGTGESSQRTSESSQSNVQ
jgi:KDO2-lipid IV(A) lauroyltransferase